MNNILGYNDYFIREIEEMIVTNEINEKNNGGIRGAINRSKSRKVKAELAEEIEMSKNIIDGIKTGLDSLSDDFGQIKKNLDNGEDGKVEKGEKAKLLDSISKLLEQSRETTWDINELIDEGEIDYAGFTANVAIASARYFGIFLFPYTSTVLIHKGYNYFFTLVKNTIRKALVMLQLNFDQFENLIITKSLMSDEMLRANDEDETITAFFSDIYKELFDKEHGSLKGKKGWEIAEKKLKAAKQKSDELRKNAKAEQQRMNAYNNLDPYNNTYTRSLETLRQYSQDDVQKHLDSIKTSMTKLAGQDVDLTTYAELIIAAAEEHAYKVSSSIYNKFAKMTEVFNLPNQVKLIKLIQSADQERLAELKKEAEEKSKKMQEQSEKEGVDKLEKTGKSIFEDERFKGELGEMSDTFEYTPKSMGRWESEDIINDTEELSDDEKHNIKLWLLAHPEILRKCHKGIQVSVVDKDSYDSEILSYVDDLIDIVKDALEEDVDENIIKTFDEYYQLNEDENKESKDNDSKKSSTGYSINIKKLDNDESKKELQDKFTGDAKDIAKIALKTIGVGLLDDKSFSNKADKIVDIIASAVKNKTGKKEIHKNTYDILKNAIEKLDDLRQHDYSTIDNKEEKSEK